jgi:hypothetical protein
MAIRFRSSLLIRLILPVARVVLCVALDEVRLLVDGVDLRDLDVGEAEHRMDGAQVVLAVEAEA